MFRYHYFNRKLSESRANVLRPQRLVSLCVRVSRRCHQQSRFVSFSSFSFCYALLSLVVFIFTLFPILFLSFASQRRSLPGCISLLLWSKYFKKKSAAENFLDYALAVSISPSFAYSRMKRNEKKQLKAKTIASLVFVRRCFFFIPNVLPSFIHK